MSHCHVTATNRFVCTGQFLWKSLSPQQNFVAATCHKKSNHTICATCWSNKILLQRQRFSQKFSSTNEAICHCDVPLQSVAATSCSTCTHRVFCSHDLLLQLVIKWVIMLRWHGEIFVTKQSLCHLEVISFLTLNWQD